MGYVVASDDFYSVRQDAFDAVMSTNITTREEASEIGIQNMVLKDILTVPSFHSLTVADCVREYMMTYEQTKKLILSNSNAKANGSGKGRPSQPRDISMYSLAFVMCKKHIIRCINLRKDLTADAGKCLVGVYDENDGLYHTEDDYIRRLAGRFNANVNTGRNFDELIKNLKSIAPIVRRSQYDEDKREWIPCKNVIFDFKTKDVHDYSAEYVFLNKLTIDYDPNAESPIFNMKTKQIDPNATHDMVDIKNYWEFKAWLLDLMSNVQEDADAIMHTICSAVRPATIRQMIGYYSRKGSSGKSTLLAMMSAIIGNTNIIWKNVDEMSGQFDLAHLTTKSAIMKDENSTNKYLDSVDVLKAILTHNTVSVRDLYKSFVDVDPCASVVQCFNAIPKVQDTTGSFLRRVYILEFKRHYDTKTDNRDIADIYTQDEQVLKYVLKEALNLPYYLYLPETKNSQACDNLMVDVNDSWVHSFIEEVLNVDADNNNFCEIDCNEFPRECMYYVYRGYVKDNKPNNRIVNDRTFYRELSMALEDDPNSQWEYDEKKTLNDKSATIKYLMGAKFDIIAQHRIPEFYDDSNRYGSHGSGYGALVVLDRGGYKTRKTRYTGVFRRKAGFEKPAVAGKNSNVVIEDAFKTAM